jgi:hypothetical protein
MIVPPVPLPRVRGQQRREQLPFFVGQIMTIQAFIHPERSTETEDQDL